MDADSLGKNSFHLAIEKNDVAMVELFLKADGQCIINVPTSIYEKRQTPLHMVVQDKSLGLLRLVMAYYKKIYPGEGAMNEVLE